MPNRHGDFIWYELMTDNADAAQEFYGAVVGWTFGKVENNPKEYRLFSKSNGVVGGVLPLTKEMIDNGARPCWMGYIGVDDVDATADAIKKAGGTIHMEPQDIPDVGRFAFVADPQGVMFYIMRGASDDVSQSFAATEPMEGHCAWNELMTIDPSKAIDFYSSQFGWRQEGDMDMGPMGKYQFLYQGPVMIGGVMRKADEMPSSAWTYYFRVRDIDTALETIKANGGQLLHEPMEVPGGEFVINGQDPQGAYFAVVGARRQSTE